MLTHLAHVASLFERVPFWALFLYDVVVLAVITLAIVRRRGFASTLAWIFAIIAVPVAGVVAYLLLANPHVARTRRAKRRATLQFRQHRGGRGRGGGERPSRLTAAERGVLQLAERLSDIAPVAGNGVWLASSNADAARRVAEGIRAARRSIWAEYYMIKDDGTGKAFLRALTERAREGLDVRLLYDAVGSWGIDASALDGLRRAGGHVEVFLPINPLRRRWAVHLRNHRKILVVDGRIAMTGGMNIGDEYSGRRGRGPVAAWRDTLLGIEGPAAGAFGEVFAEDWSFATGTEEILDVPRAAGDEGGGSLVAVLPSGPDQEANAARLSYFAGITSAVSRCWIASPYFIPDGPTNRALVAAALRGVDVRVLLPQRNDVTLMGPASRSYYSALVRAGARIFEYRPAMLHSKLMSIDGRWCLIGSANVDVRSFWLNFEISALVFDPAFAASVEEQFERDLAESDEITPEILSARGFWAALGEGVARLMSPLL